jgi:hypothetical protein
LFSADGIKIFIVICLTRGQKRGCSKICCHNYFGLNTPVSFIYFVSSFFFRTSKFVFRIYKPFGDFPQISLLCLKKNYMSGRLNHVILYILLLIPTSLTGQVLFQSTFGGLDHEERLYSVIQTNDGGYIATGFTRSFAEDRNAYIVKIDRLGKKEWSTVLGDIGNDRGREVRQTPDGGYIMTGYTGSYGPGILAVWLIKLSPDGEVEWSKAYGGAGDDRGFDIEITSDGGFIIAGYSNSFSPTDEYDLYLIKTDSTGNLEWANAYGGTGESRGYSVVETADGGFAITGRTNSYGAGDDDIYLVKVDENGNFEWGSAFGGAGEDRSYGMALADDGGFVIIGRTQSFRGIYDLYLVKADSDGEYEWSRTFGGLGNDIGRSIRTTPDGDFILSGYARSFGGNDDFLYALKVDGNGNLIWERAFGGSERDRGFSVNLADDGYIFGGYSENYSGNELEYYLVKTDFEGNSACNQIEISSTISMPPTSHDRGGTQRGDGVEQVLQIRQAEPFTIERNLCCIPGAGFTYEIDGKEVSFEALTRDADEYFWEFGDGNSASESDAIHVYDEEKSYEVCLTVDIQACGNPGRNCQTIHLGTNMLESGFADGSLQLYPNPVSGVLTID